MDLCWARDADERDAPITGEYGRAACTAGCLDFNFRARCEEAFDIFTTGSGVNEVARRRGVKQGTPCRGHVV